MIELLVIVFVISLYFIKASSSEESLRVDVNISDLQSHDMEYDNGWKLLDGKVNEETAILFGPYLPLESGRYILNMEYDCESDLQIELRAEKEHSAYIEANPFNLDHNLHSISYRFKVNQPVDYFDIYVTYSGGGNVSINDLTIVRSLDGYKIAIFYVILIIILLNVLLFFRKELYRNRQDILFLLSIVLLISIPLFMKGIHVAHDTKFHFMRFEGLSEELRLGHFPSRIQSLWVSGNGYPVSIYYCDLLLIFPALLRLTGFTIIEAYKAYVMFVNALTVLIAYLSFLTLFKKDKRLALLLTLVYSASTYRLVSLYTKAAVGEYTAMAFFPLIVAAIYKIYENTTSNHKPEEILGNSIMLAIGWSGVISSHVISTEICMVLMVGFCLINIQRTLNKKVLLTMFLGFAETSLLTAFFVVPFLDYILNVDVSVKYVSQTIQEYGAYILQLFSFFQTPSGWVGSTVSDRLSSTPGAVLILSLCLAYFLMVMGRANRTIIKLSLYSSIILWMSTDLFPWNRLARIPKVGDALTAIQFPLRYLGPSCIVLTTLLGFLMVYLSSLHNSDVINHIYYATVAITCISLAVFFGQYLDGMQEVNPIDRVELDTNSAYQNGEYLRVDSSGDPITYVQSDVDASGVEVSVIERKGTNMIISANSRDGGTVSFPLTNYKGYSIRDEYGERHNVFDDKNCKVACDVPSGYNGNLTVSFEEPWYWRLAEIISLASFVALAIICLRLRQSYGTDTDVVNSSYGFIEEKKNI